MQGWMQELKPGLKPGPDIRVQNTTPDARWGENYMVKQLVRRLGRFFSIFGGFSSREDIQRAQAARQSRRVAPRGATEEGEVRKPPPPDAKA